MLSPSERVLRARIAAHSMHAQHDPVETTRVARQALHDSFLAKVDPDLPEAERVRRADSARKAFYARLAFRSAQVRRQRAEGGKPDLLTTLADAAIIPQPGQKKTASVTQAPAVQGVRDAAATSSR